ncbi:hypothetical protein DL96DRAFT_1714027 [Flagelloscypha sp. PMI_526]|nr:hypothetical protein DL96DRAFT_1714027 [Flagelloscypha sp. PMI_526]
MGNLVWHEYARLVSATASICSWSCALPRFLIRSYQGPRCYLVRILGPHLRKFLWDFVGGTLRDPGGLQPAPGAAVFVALIVQVPIVPIFAMIIGGMLLAIEFPEPWANISAAHRSIVVRMVLLVFQTFLCLLYYQGTNAAIYSLIALLCYARALVLGEKLVDVKKGRAWCGWCLVLRSSFDRDR